MSHKARRRPSWKKPRHARLIHRLRRSLRDLRAGNYVMSHWTLDGKLIGVRYRNHEPVGS